MAKLTKEQLKIIRDRFGKALMSNKMICANVLHDYVPEYRNIPVEEIAEKYLTTDPVLRQKKVHSGRAPSAIIAANSESSSPDDGSVYFDVILYALAPGTEDDLIGIVLNFEIQVKTTPGYPLPKRAEYYVARAISEQYETIFPGSGYDQLRKVYSIWIMPYAPQEYGNNVLRFPASHEPEVIVGQNHYSPEDYGHWNYIFIEIGNPEALTEKDALDMLAVLFRGGEDRDRKLHIDYGIALPEDDDHNLEEVDQMMMEEVDIPNMVLEDRMRSIERRARQEGRLEAMQEVEAEIQAVRQKNAALERELQQLRQMIGTT